MSMEATQEMKMALQRYPAYKDSGVDWLGEIPEGWEVKKLKNAVEIRNGQDHKHIIAESGYPVIGSGGAFAYASEYLHDGEVVFLGRKGTIDRPLYFEGRFWVVDTMFYVIVNKENNVKFFYYQATRIPFGLYSTSTALPSMTMSDLYNHVIAIPPLSEQTRIAAFLDRKTAQIDQAIAQKERLIALLKERRQIMIQQAVTRGLDPNVEMKDSGVEWIGEIPKHWEVRRISWLFEEKDETNYPHLPLLVVSINTGVTVRDMEDENQKQMAEDFKVYKRAVKGDISFNKMRMWQGAVGVVPQDGLVSPDYVVARPRAIVNSAYFGYLLKTGEYLAEFIKHSHGIAWDRNRLYWEDFKTILGILPPIEVQSEIVDYIHKLEAITDKAISQAEKQIEKLRELRATLIDAAVTGKIMV